MDKSSAKILTPLQIEALDRVFSDAVLGEQFYLTGCTALSAFYLHHRYSDDLDFFTHAQSVSELWPAVQRLVKDMKGQVVRRSPDFFRAQVGDGLQLDFVRDVPFRVGVPERIGKWYVDNRENITVNKVGAILGRLDPKDYVDLYYLIRDKPARIMSLMEQASKKDAGVDPFLWSRIIGDARTMRVLPRMILPLAIEEIQRFYEKLQELILEKIKPA